MRSDETYMRRALVLARRGAGYVSPNPMVGAIVVRNDQVVGAGYHRHFGGVHAEVEALASAGEKAKGATLYVTLEPCNHEGRNPPCTAAILRSGIARVVVAMKDPNPVVQGGGVEFLDMHGVEVAVGCLERQAAELNIAWLHYLKTGRPFVRVKLALSRDGRLAWPTASAEKGDRWISSPSSRALVHRLRRGVDAVMVGVGTVLADDPSLTNRSGRGHNPFRVVLDSTLKTPLSAKVVSLSSTSNGSGSVKQSGTVILTTEAADVAQESALKRKMGVEVVRMASRNSRVDLHDALHHLGERGIISVLCEGGAELARGLLQDGLCDRLILFESPDIIGGCNVARFESQAVDTSDQSVLRFSGMSGRDTVRVYDWSRHV